MYRKKCGACGNILTTEWENVRRNVFDLDLGSLFPIRLSDNLQHSATKTQGFLSSTLN